MTIKACVKTIVDLLMVLLMPVQMAYSITGEATHRITGMILCIIVIVHNILNLQWYKNLFKGTYTAARIFQTVINFGTIICFLGLMVSGIMMSTTLFAMGFIFPSNFARLCHLLCAYWGFAFMSLHLGLHWKMFMGMFGKAKNGDFDRLNHRWSSRLLANKSRPLSRIIAVLIAAFGVYAFIDTNVWQYMFGIAQYLILEYTPTALFFSEYIAMMGMWVFVGHYGLRLAAWKK
jgi:hypothetical protein